VLLLWGKCQGIYELGHGPPPPDHGGLYPKWPPPPNVAEAFNQSEPNSGFNSHIHPTKGRIASKDHTPPEANPPVLTCQGLQPRHRTR
jgi:hypothetical protein